MPSLRHPRRLFAASDEPAPETVPPPEPASSPSADETTALREGATVEAEEVDSRDAASDPPGQKGEEEESGPDWSERFATVDELWAAFRNVDHIRGRHANELGQLRRQVRLYARTIRLLARTVRPFERQALVQAAGLIPEPRTLEKIEEMIAAGEQVHEEEEAASALG